MTAVPASLNSPRTGGGYAAAPSAGTSVYLTPTVILVLVLLYTLLFTQIIGGAFVTHSDLDSALNETASRSNAVNQAFWFLLLAITVFVAVMRRTDPLQAGRALVPLFAYLAWSAITLPWAADRHIALRRLLLQICIVGSIWLPIAMIRNAAHVRRIVLYVMFIIVLANVAVAIIFKPTELGYAGLFGQKNGLGAAAALAFITFLFSFTRRRSADNVISSIGLVLSLALLIASRSKTSIILSAAVPLVVCAVTVLTRNLRIRPAAVVLAAVGISCCAVVIALSFGLHSDTILHALFGGDTFTGRTDIWSFAWSEFLTRPFIGFGFNGFWGVGTNSAATYANNAFIVDILQAHEGYLDVLLETGLVGLAILIAFVLITLRNCSRVIRQRGGPFFLAMTLFFVLHNFFESSVFRRFEPVWVAFLIAAVAVGVEQQPKQRVGQRISQERPAC